MVLVQEGEHVHGVGVCGWVVCFFWELVAFLFVVSVVLAGVSEGGPGSEVVVMWSV